MFVKIVLTILGVLALASVIRIILGPTIWDRLLALNLFSSKIIMLIVLFAVVMQKSYLLDIAIVYVLLGFISIIFIANFIQKKGKI
ncbi:monovalent cation/H+ antiporter complex subunit F [Petroclostridium sp. X23]|uniref:monovalent cation/H+ antiporter complex subunit F n=1 Tax=Petroclostridium sp. X23 TaxID=3045146 RepID=UPI0024ADC071|nr:monovalent cation/H+ antiporter complex subunit F [Petroclostridium sp. X23]WHH57695.1 monovalent cation/H+ antiporter complex subunit F [Petroclostridium sp. X23]